MRPTSRGTIRLQSRDPAQAPLIDPNFLATKQDVEDQRKALRLTIEIMNQPAFNEYRSEILSPKIDISSDDQCDAFVRSHSHSGYHLSCTSAMGRVVDPEGKVYGMNSLRVIDASVMPSMVSGNLNASTIMLAEKLVDGILGQQLPAEEVKFADPDTSKQR